MTKGILALVATVATVAATVVAGGAGAATTERGSSVNVNLRVIAPGGVPSHVRNFRFRRLKAECGGSITARIRGTVSRIRINNRRRFRHVNVQPDSKLRIRGRVNRNLTRVRGTIRANGDFGPTAQDCDSGRTRWRVQI